jgi:hypothetical protein
MNETSKSAGEATAAAEPAPATPAPGEYRLHPRVRDVWFWQAVVFASVACAPGAIIGPLLGSWLWLPVAVLAATLIVRLLRAYGGAYVARFRCRLLPDGLMVLRGVWWHSETFVPRARVQHTDVTQGPIARRFGLATLKVYTAGTHVGEISVEGLARADAITLRDELLGRHGRDAV